MSSENYFYRTNPLFLRNEFYGCSKFDIPIIPKPDIDDEDLKNLLLIGFDQAKSEKDEHFDRMVHFFLYDYNFEKVWEEPEPFVERLRKYKAVLTPDFSIYTDMATTIQLYNTFRNRWCGAYFASKGLKVIPTVNWGLAETFDFCFEGIEKGSTVAVSTYMFYPHDENPGQEDVFMKGYNEMFRRIEPKNIICYNTPFDAMQGNITHVDYNLSSWRYY